MFQDAASADWLKQLNEAETNEIEKDDKVTKMRAILSPFILRRLKSEVSSH
jgi:hypothetical protein